MVAWFFLLIVLLEGDANGSDEFEDTNGSTPLLVWIPLLAVDLASTAAIVAVYVWSLAWMVRQCDSGPNLFGSDPRAWADEA